MPRPEPYAVRPGNPQVRLIPDLEWDDAGEKVICTHPCANCGQPALRHSRIDCEVGDSEAAALLCDDCL